MDHYTINDHHNPVLSADSLRHGWINPLWTPGQELGLLFVIIWLNTNLFSNMDSDRGPLYKTGNNAAPLSSIII